VRVIQHGFQVKISKIEKARKTKKLWKHSPAALLLDGNTAHVFYFLNIDYGVGKAIASQQ